MQEGSQMTAVYKVMSSAPVTVTPSTSVTDLLTLFDRYDYNAFPVLGPEGRLVGIVSKLDVLRLFVVAEVEVGNREEGRCAGDVMQREVIYAKAEDNLVEAGNLMISAKLRSVPVVRISPSGPSVVGMLSRSDVLRGLRFQLDLEAVGASRGPSPEQSHLDLQRESVETLIDQMGDQSFPASDPPAWGVVRARLGRVRENRPFDDPAVESPEQ
jgi:CBS domain-containing protein